MGCCKTGRSYSDPFHFRKYPCRKEDSKDPCPPVTLQGLRATLETKEAREEQGAEEENYETKQYEAEKTGPCENAKPLSKKKFQKMATKQICAMPYSRSWNLQSSPDGPPDGFSKWFNEERRASVKGPCLDGLIDFEKISRILRPKCPPKKKTPCRDPIDQAVCVFCLESLYIGGYLHELFEKVPLIKKRSQLYGDEIAWRIGIRTRVIVHKKCYNSYIDIFSHKKGDKEEVDFELGNEEIEGSDSEDLNCGQEEGEEEEVLEEQQPEPQEQEEPKQQEQPKQKRGKCKEVQKKKIKDAVSKKQIEESAEMEMEEEFDAASITQYSRKQYFCLRKYKIPKISCACVDKSFFKSYKGSRILYFILIRDRKQIYLNSGVNTVSSEMARFKPHGLVADLWPNIRLLQLSGHFLHEYHDDNSAMNVLMRKMYSFSHLILVFIHFAAIIANLAMEADDVNILAANSITVLFFTHCVTKFCYFALRRQKFYRTLAVWDTQNSHPLFAESHARHRAAAITKSRRLLMITVIGTLMTVVGWTGSTFFGESTKMIPDPENTNDTIKVEIPRLMLRAWYPWDASSGSNYMFSFVYQLYWLVFTLFHANLVDLLFCSWLIFACEQLLHVKEIMKPLIDLSSSLDTYNPGSSDLFKAAGAISDNVENFYDSKDERQINIRSIYSNMRDFGMTRNAGAINAVNGIGPNGLSKKHEMLVRSAIKYWVERHKHIVRYVGAIGDAYGLALLLHMLTSTITLTLLAYQATKIEGMDLYAMSVLGYLFYSLAQVFAFCIYGNQLIEESSSVMEAAYSCQWYDGSEEAKTFVQIVCQQCQKALSISGAKFFTVSLDLFASVLGAVVTYFMVLVQLK